MTLRENLGMPVPRVGARCCSYAPKTWSVKIVVLSRFSGSRQIKDVERKTLMKDLNGKTAIVTGAASGIGLGIATALSQAG